MANPNADYPTAIHTAIDISAYANTALGKTAVTHTDVHGKIEQEILSTQTKIGKGASTPVADKVLMGGAGATSSWETISHTILSDIGTNTHVQGDSHIGSTSNPHSVTLAQVGGTTDHTALSNIGVNSHSDIDTFIATTVPTTYLPLAGGTMTGGIVNSTSINPLTTLAESWIGPSTTTGIYFKGGNVGIGTTNPGQKLEVAGSLYVNGGVIYLNNNLYLAGKGTAGGNLTIAKVDTSNNLQIGEVNTLGNILFMPGATEKVRITNSGNVGIGTTGPTRILGIGGLVARNIGMERGTVANTAGFALTVNSGGATSGATDKNGGDILITSGISTGSGFSSVKLQAVTAGATGTADRTVTTHLEVGNSKFALFGGTPAVQQSTIVDADGTLADITTKFNTLLASLEAYGLLKSA